jgi:hypothetical protein
LLETLIARDGRTAQVCVRWLVTGVVPLQLEVDVAWVAVAG